MRYWVRFPVIPWRFFLEGVLVKHNNIQGNSSFPPELPNSAAQQPRQTQQKGAIEHL
jgi:hypothetical protein